MSLYEARGKAAKFSLFVANEAMRQVGWSRSPETLLERFQRREKNGRRCVYKATYTLYNTRMAYEAIVVIKKGKRGNWTKGQVTLVHCSGNWIAQTEFSVVWDDGFPREIKLGDFAWPSADEIQVPIEQEPDLFSSLHGELTAVGVLDGPRFGIQIERDYEFSLRTPDAEFSAMLHIEAKIPRTGGVNSLVVTCRGITGTIDFNEKTGTGYGWFQM